MTLPKPGPGEKLVSCRATARHVGYEVGATLRLPRVAGGGGPDGRYFTVVADAGRWQKGAVERVGAIVRAATAEEAAPYVGRRAAATRRMELLVELSQLVQSAASRTAERAPPGREYVLRQLAGQRRFVLAPDGSVWLSDSTDDGERQTWRSAEPRARELMTKLLDTD